MRLIIKLLLGIVIGILVGFVSPDALSRVFATFRDIFGQLLEYVIPLIIIFFIASGISGFRKGSGKMLGYSAGLAYASTILAGTLAYFVAWLVLPLIVSGNGGNGEEASGFESFLDLEIEPLAGVLAALLTAFVFGIGITKVNGSTLKGFFDEGKEIIEKMIWKMIIPILPLYIGTIFAELAADGTVFETLKAFGLVLALAIAMHWVWLIVLYTVAGAVTNRNPFSMLKTMLPAYFTGLGTMSSAATIPVTVRSTKQNKVSEGISDAVVPLCATIHLSGSTITLTTAAIAVVIISDNLLMPSFGLMIQFIILLGLIMIAAPGVPGGAVMAALGILGSVLGFDETALGLMIAVYTAQDGFGTATNVTGDGAIALMVDKWLNKGA